MYYLVGVDCNSMAIHLTSSDYEGFKKCCITSAVDQTDDDTLWNDGEEDGNVTSERGEGEGTDCEDGH